jgi:dTDP-4-dehydrorhamnose reductase
MKILITGANGLLGHKLVDLLPRQPGVVTIATARRTMSGLPPAVLFSRLDITDREQVQSVIALHRPDVIIHTAAMTNVDQCESEKENCWRANVESVNYLIEASRKIQARLIHVSTDFIFDGSHGPLDESATPNPVNFYGESKLAAEKEVINSRLHWTIVRTVLVYGVTPDLSRSNIVLWVKKSLEEEKSIRVVTDQWRTPTLAEDLAMGCYLVAQKKATGIFHISGEEMLTPYDIAIQTAEFFHLDKGLIARADSHTFQQPARRPPKTGFIIDKAKAVLGYQPHTFKEGLARVAAQLKR